MIPWIYADIDTIIDCYSDVEDGEKMRLIDADAYKAEMKQRQDACAEWRDEAKARCDTELYIRADGALATFVEAKLTLDKMPTVDAVPVVRCRDCIHADEYGHCEMQMFWGTRDDYCSRGQRREDGDT